LFRWNGGQARDNGGLQRLEHELAGGFELAEPGSSWSSWPALVGPGLSGQPGES
jgi:hypothetical protein